jgi:hypothetical protein
MRNYELNSLKNYPQDVTINRNANASAPQAGLSALLLVRRLRIFRSTQLGLFFCQLPPPNS